MKSNSERVDSSKFKRTLYIKLDIFYTLRGVSDSFVKQGTPVPSSTSPANPDVNVFAITHEDRLQ